MRKLVYVVGISLALFGVSSAPAWADNGPHTPSVSKSMIDPATGKYVGGNFATDSCAGCHRAHTAQASYLLKQAQPNLCYTCHGSTTSGATTDVVDGVGITATGGLSGLRGGGFVNAVIGSGAAVRTAAYTDAAGAHPATKTVPVLGTGAPVTSSHSVNGSSVMAWGNGTTGVGNSISLRCGSCHDPHGNGNYRILRPVPQESGGVTTLPGITDVPTPADHVYTTTNYWSTDDAKSVTVTGTDATGATITKSTSFISGIAQWCSQCHTRYLATSNSYQTPRPGEGTYMYQHRSDQTNAGGANCITCHVAHGSNAAMSGVALTVTNPDSTDAGTDSRLLRVDNRGTCVMCHSK